MAGGAANDPNSGRQAKQLSHPSRAAAKKIISAVLEIQTTTKASKTDGRNGAASPLGDLEGAMLLVQTLEGNPFVVLGAP